MTLPRFTQRPGIWFAFAAAVLLGIGLYLKVDAAQLEARLLRTPTDRITQDPDLMRLVDRQAPALYAEHCAACHGARLQGDPGKGAPRLTDGVWVYGNGAVSDIETIVLYGIRSGHPKSHNLTDMPGLGRSGQLSREDVHDVVEYLLLIGQQPHDAAAAERGRKVYQDTGVCYDCHASDGYGVSDYGSPGLIGRENAWMYGGDRDTLFKSVYDGRHGLCPAWIGKLSFAQIRALAVYLYQASHGGRPPDAS